MVDLSGLKDIHLAEIPDFFPPAPTVWILFLSVLLVIALFISLRILWNNSPRHYALRLLDFYHSLSQENTVAFVSDISSLLKRIAIRKDVSSGHLFGEEWIDFLNSHADEPLSREEGNFLASAPYRKKENAGRDEKMEKNICAFARKWIIKNTRF